MTILEERIKEKGLKKVWLAEKIDIDTRTLNYWLKYNKLTQVEKFIKLLLLLDTPVVEVLEEMFKEKEKKDKK